MFINTKRVLSFLLLVSLVGSFLGCSTAPTKIESASTFKPRPFQEYTLKNGLKVLVVQDESLPYFSLSMVVRTGGIGDPKGQDGVAAMTAALLDRGTRKRNSVGLAEALNDLATEFDAGVSSDSTSLKVSSLSKDQDQLLKLFAEIVLEPSFDPTEVERTRKEMTSNIAKLSDSASGFADRAFDQILFAGSKYGRPDSGSVRSLKGIRREHLLKFYETYYRPGNSQLVVVGKMLPGLTEKIESLFGSWKAKDTPPPEPGVPLPIQGYDVTVVDKADMTQSQIRMGHFSLKRSHPDFLKVRIASVILGSGFTSRLMSRIRDELGLTYSVSSQYSALRDIGALEIKTFTRNEKLGQMLQELISVYDRYYQEGATDQEVQDAKSFLIGQFPQAIETAESWAANLALLRLYGIPDTYLTEFTPTVQKITTDDIRRAIKDYFSPSTLRILVYSTEKSIREQMKDFKGFKVVPYQEFQ